MPGALPQPREADTAVHSSAFVHMTGARRLPAAVTDISHQLPVLEHLVQLTAAGMLNILCGAQVAAFQMEASISALYSMLLEAPTKVAEKRAQVGGVGFGFSMMILFLTYALAFWCASCPTYAHAPAIENVQEALGV